MNIGWFLNLLLTPIKTANKQKENVKMQIEYRNTCANDKSVSLENLSLTMNNPDIPVFSVPPQILRLHITECASTSFCCKPVDLSTIDDNPVHYRFSRRSSPGRGSQ